MKQTNEVDRLTSASRQLEPGAIMAATLAIEIRHIVVIMKPKFWGDVIWHCAQRDSRAPASYKSGTVMHNTKKFLLASACLVALAAPAAAADMAARPYKAPPAPAPLATVYSWTGFYIGGHVGGAWAGDNSSLFGNNGRFLGGVQAGADYQFDPNWVVGLEGQYSWLANNNGGGVVFPGGGVATQNTRGLGSATARIGWTWGPGLLYAKGGYAFTDKTLGVTVAGLPAPFGVSGNSKNGWTVGGGLEYMFAPNWSVKGEYQYYNFGNTTFTAGPAPLVGTRFRDDEHTVKVGVNYRFGWR